MLEILISTYTNSNFLRSAVDISQAFIQADVLHEKDQSIASLPDMISITDANWEGGIYPSTRENWVEELKNPPGKGAEFVEPGEDEISSSIRKVQLGRGKYPKYGLLLRRPLYGSRDAPLRWWLRLSRAMRGCGYKQTRMDVYFYSI